MSCDDDVFIMMPRNKSDLEALHKVCMQHGREMAPATVNEEKVRQRLYHAFQHPDLYTMLMALSGEQLIGYLNLHKVQWWFSDDCFLCDWGLYVIPEFRKGEALAMLLRAAKVLAKAAEMHVRIAITNPERRRGRMNREAEIAGFTPVGAMLRFGAPKPDTLN